MRTKRALRISVADGAFWSVMVGLSECYFGPFAVELGHGPTTLALLGTIPLLAGALSQLAAPALTRLLGGRKTLVVASAVVQALVHVALIVLAFDGERHAAPLIVAATAYSVAGTVLAPAWNAWMADLTADTNRERYFGLRSGALQVGLLAGYVGGGLLLYQANASKCMLAGYVAAFAIALVARVISAALLACQHEPSAHTRLERGVLEGVRASITRGRWRIAVYSAALMFGAWISVPFFAPYMLRTLALDYRMYAACNAIAILIKIPMFAMCHKLAARFGLPRLLLGSGLALSLVSGLWASGTGVTTIVAAQVISGFAWAGVEYAVFQLLLVSAEPDYQLEFFALAGALTGVAQLLGALLSSQLIEHFGFGYVDLFWLSCVARGLPALLLVPVRR